MAANNTFDMPRLPGWLKTRFPGGPDYTRLKSLVNQHGLNTVCESASCPNLGECWSSGTLTIMILGDHCTRACRFCDVPTGQIQPPDNNEPMEVAGMLSKLKLRYVVITSVDRDDLPDGGAGLWAQTISEVRKASPKLLIESLIPDFRGNEKLISIVCKARPDVLSHNIETVSRLQKEVRPQCSYHWSLKTLEISSRNYGLVTKSGLMLGHGETEEEVVQTMDDLFNAGCRILTLGQYLKPSKDHREVVEYVHPDIFEKLKDIGKSIGFDHVESGPLVRSSYLADQQAKLAGI